MVANLLLPSREWKKPLIEWTFCPVTAERILEVVLPITPTYDSFFWMGANDGVYSAKSGYLFLQQVDGQGIASSSTTDSMEEGLWKIFWAAPSLPRCQELSWRLYHGVVPICQKLCQGAVDVDPSCPICRLEDESIDHLFLRCAVMKDNWFASRLGVRVYSHQRFPVFLRLLVRDFDDEGVTEVHSLLYTMWEARNREVFYEHIVDWREVLARAGSMRVPQTEETPRTVAGAVTGLWIRPTRGIIKVNIDADVGRDKLVGFGMGASNNNGEIMASSSMYPTLVLSPSIGEGLSLRWAMELATQLGLQRVLFETGCLPLFQAWKKASGGSYLFTVIQDCFRFCNFFDFVDLSLVHRDGNYAADFKERNASTFTNEVWIEERPSGLILLLLDDSLASMPI
ncbi:uncharacterized protein LOC130736128 [Lotus japonicus]|uniref:uncharacterized protein LOC130736128 n=1 Tax=Lotus japonicus TaxID=34305 RepID=UPI002590B313|nr:uncharacterized protein LOC130736128 [Lotus japonicus]